ncbi:MAG: HDOD domain-containing protein [Proteobacteria bacterium]|nr:HDOD domain-containing protein [Pseudomonadota bacterium]
MSASAIQALFAQPAALPTMPKVVQQVLASFGRDDVAVADIAPQLAAEPVLAAKTLRLANSAYFRVSRRIASVDDALQMLGFAMVRNLVAGCSMTAAFKGLQGVDLPAFWQHSLHTAVAARWLAPQAGQSGDVAFVIGLMHGLGHLVMHAAAPDGLAALDARVPLLSPQRAAAERAALGYDHAEVGAELARQWQFPAELSAPLACVPAPGGEAMAALIHLAAWRARVEEAAEVEADPPQAVAASLGLTLTWDGQARTLTVASGGRSQTMPPLAELSEGLEAMLG